MIRAKFLIQLKINLSNQGEINIKSMLQDNDMLIKTLISCILGFYLHENHNKDMLSRFKMMISMFI